MQPENRRSHAGSAFVNTFRDLRDHSNTSLVAAGLLLLPSLGTTFLASYLGNRIVSLIAFPVTLALGIWLQASLIRATHLYATGSDPGAGELLATSAHPGRLISLLGVQLILFLLWTAIFIVTLAPAFGVGIAGLSASGGDFGRMMNGGLAALFVLALLVGFGLFVFLGLVVLLRYGLAAAANVIERRAAPESFSRSRAMTEGRWADLFLLYLMLLGTVIALGIALLVPAGIVTGSMGNRPDLFSRDFTLDLFAIQQLQAGPAALVALSSYLFSVFITTVVIGAITNFYLGVRADEAMLAATPTLEESPARSDWASSFPKRDDDPNPNKEH